MLTFLEGLLLGLAFVMPIGMQNLYVIKSALNMGTPSAYRVAFAVSIADMSLAFACFIGLGSILIKYAFIKDIYLSIGILFFIYIGFKTLQNNTTLDIDNPIFENTISIVKNSFVLTWFNIQAILDGAILLGASRLSMYAHHEYEFLLGIICASPLWFFSLTKFLSDVRHILPQYFFKIVNVICGCVLILFALKLTITLIGNFK